MYKSLLEYLITLDSLMSRTVIYGVGKTDISSFKRPLLLKGIPLLRQIELNRESVTRYIIWRMKYIPDVEFEHYNILCSMAELTNMNILPESLFRSWCYVSSKYGVNYQGQTINSRRIPQGLQKIATQVIKIKKLNTHAEKVKVISNVEWQIAVGPLHPFYDGCGRIARYYSTLLSLWFETGLVIHKSREEYFDAARKGRNSFYQYYLLLPRSKLW